MSTSLKYRFEHIKNQIDSLDYMSSNVRLKKVGLVLRGLCPFHNEKTPSLTIYPPGYQRGGETQENASFYCFGCGAGGDVFEFRRRREGLNTTYDALKKFEEELGIDSEDDEVQLSVLKESINKIKNSKEHMLTIPEINMICSSMCRNYIAWVKDEYPQFYGEEKSVVEKFYKYFDFVFNEKSAFDCMKLVDEVKDKIKNRRINITKRVDSIE